MDISNKILGLRNRVLAKMLLEVSVEGDAEKEFYPDKCNILNKKTGEKWSAEFYSYPYDDPDGISPTEWYAQLKDERGKVLEKRDIDRNFSTKIADSICIGDSGFGPIWSSVNTAFKDFQQEHRRIQKREAKMEQTAKTTSAMRRLDDFLRK